MKLKDMRDAFIRRVYELTHGDITKRVDAREIGNELGLDNGTLRNTVDYLRGQRYIETGGLGTLYYQINITIYGIDHVKASEP